MRSFILLFGILLLFACDKDEPVPAVSTCIQEKIGQLEAAAEDADVQSIDQYRYNGRTVYLFHAECCDLYNYVTDGSCEPVCSPSGGVSGGGDCTCPDFFKQASFIRRIWEK